MINRRFFTWHEKQRPYVILKWARSADGFIDLVRNADDPVEPHWITGMTERILVHRWRAAEDAILVGGATVRADNPSLDVRFWNGKNPLRVVVSRSGNIDPRSRVFDASTETLLFTCNETISLPGVQIVRLTGKDDFIDEILRTLHSMGVQSLFIEGGAFMIRSFIEAGAWDEARRFTGMMIFGNGVPDPFPAMRPENVLLFEKSKLEITHHFDGNSV